MRKLIFLVITSLLLFTLPVFKKEVLAASSYYVSPSGNDANPGTLSQPWRSLQKAANILTAGDTVYVRGGVYQESVTFTNSGTAASPINILAYPDETPIIDGGNFSLPSYWSAMLRLAGDYLYASGFEVRNGNWMGVVLAGRHNKVSNFNVHHQKENGIIINGNYGIAEDNLVWSNCLSNENGLNTRGTWASGLSAARHPSYAIIRRNKVFNIWGEGVSTYEAEHTTIEDNIIYDNWSANLYISDTKYSLIQRNLVYRTPNNILGGSGIQTGIVSGDELYNPPSSDNTIINNFVMGTKGAYVHWGEGLVNTLVANNTFVNAATPTSGFPKATVVINGVNTNSLFRNNLVLQEDSLDIASINSKTGLALSNNLWSKTPPANAAGANDIIANPQLVKIGSTGPGQLQPDWFKILGSSPARDKAVSLTTVKDDFFRAARGSNPDIGGHEYQGSAPGDVNGDGKVDMIDIGIIIDHYWTSPPTDPRADLDKNDIVNIVDIGIVIDHYD